MPQKPLDKRNSRNRELVWRAIRELRSFTAKELSRATGRPEKSLREYLMGLTKSSHLECLVTKPKTNRTIHVYTLVKDCWQAPRVRKDGSKVTQGIGNEQMWRSMKMLGSFCKQDLVATSTEEHPVTSETAKTYISYLLKAEYLAVVREASPGVAGRYRLINNTGNLPPKIQRVKQVFDPNLGEVVWPKGDDDE